MHFFNKKNYIFTLALLVANSNLYARNIDFNSLFNDAWNKQPNSQNIEISKRIVDLSQKQAISIFSQKPSIEISSSLGIEKEYNLKANFEFKNKNQRNLSLSLLDNQNISINLEQLKDKLEFSNLLRNACWELITVQKKLEAIQQEISFSIILRDNIFKEYKSGIISYINFQQTEIELLKLQRSKQELDIDLQDKLNKLINISNSNIQPDDNINMNSDLNLYQSIFSKNDQFNVENHPIYKYQQNILENSYLQKNYLLNKPQNPITWSVGINSKTQNKTNNSLIFGMQIPLGRDYSKEIEASELEKKSLQQKTQLNLLRNQLENDFIRNKNLSISLAQQLNNLQTAINQQKQIYNSYFKGLQVGQIDMQTYLKSKQDLFNLQQDFINQTIRLEKVKSDLLQNLGILP